ncbi:PH domain-containing protein [Roseibium aggregatum]|uniref:PH domain-containing protein n=1 Tax=Roseibium aggregatum TaxID=187304 RepID=A0A926NX71_9HYPH|nr:PH domain-containing protein [Roseibium aggregatum]MBD1545971.1 PH domain-containing protein [Roseibium aggregatum]
MRNLLYRFLAYLIAGFAGGAAVWLFFQVPAGGWETGVVFLIAATGLLAAAYLLRTAGGAPVHGIRTNPAWSIMATDMVCIIAAATAMFFIVDGFSERLGGPRAMVADPLASDVIAFMFVPSALILAWFVAQSGSQSVAVDSDGVVVTGPFGVETFGWNEIEGFRADSQYVPVSRAGMAVPRHLRTNLQVIAGDGRTVSVYQPGLARDRRLILSALKDHAPKDLQQDLADIEAAWL